MDDSHYQTMDAGLSTGRAFGVKAEPAQKPFEYVDLKIFFKVTMFVCFVDDLFCP